MNAVSDIQADAPAIDADLIDEVASDLALDDFNEESTAVDRWTGCTFHPEFGECFASFFESANNQGYYTDKARAILEAEMVA